MPAGRSLDARRLERLEEAWGKEIARHEGRTAGIDLAKYEDDPVGFAREVLHDDRIWPKTEEMMLSVRDNAQTAVRGANSVGKDHTAAELALWFAYVKKGLVLVTGPTQRQVDEIVFGRELRELWSRSGLPGQMLARAVRPNPRDDAPPDPAVLGSEQSLRQGILGFVSTDLAKLTGHHAPRVMCIVTEAQGVEPIVFESMFNNATGDQDRLLVVGNPSDPTGRFFRACRPRSGWNALRIAAHEHPNVVQGKVVIPGGPTKQWIDRVRREEGEGSRFWKIFVEAEFPDAATDSIVTRTWVDEAFARWNGPRMTEGAGRELVIGLDVAREGGDRCVAAPVIGPVVYPMTAWRPDERNPTMDTVAKAEAVAFVYGAIASRAGVNAGGRKARFVVDVALMGGGVADVLRDRGWDVEEWNGARSAKFVAKEAGRVQNMRSWGYLSLREAFRDGIPVVAPDEEVAEDLLATRYEAGTQDAFKVVSKAEIRGDLGRSPDKGDALMMAWSSANAGGFTTGGVSGDYGF